MNTLKQFLQKRETYLGLAAAIAFQIIFFIVWLTAYDGVYDRVDQIEVAIVTEDEQIGAAVKKTLLETDVVQTQAYESLKEAKQALERHEVEMVVHIDNYFTDQLLTVQHGVVDYYINQTNPTLLRQMMEGIAGEMTERIDREVFLHINQAVLPEQVMTQADIPAQAQPMADELVINITENMIQHPVEGNVIKVHDRDGFAISMIPLLIVLASFIGAMLISQHLQLAEGKLTGKHSVMSSFLARQVINLVAAAMIACLTIGLLSVFHVEINKSLLSLWGFQMLLFYSFLAVSQLFVILFGNIGMVVNIVLTALQLATSGALVPRVLLSTTYQHIGDYLPATYGVNGYFAFIYGGGSVQGAMNDVALITGGALFIAAVVVLCKYRLTKRRRELTE